MEIRFINNNQIKRQCNFILHSNERYMRNFLHTQKHNMIILPINILLYYVWYCGGKSILLRDITSENYVESKEDLSYIKFISVSNIYEYEY